MTIKIRSNVFETNSSSVHTIVFHPTAMDNVVCTDLMYIRGGQYGRIPKPPLNTMEERLNYLWTAIWSNCIETFNFDTQKYESNWDELKWWKDAIHLYCPNAILYNLNDDDGYDYPYVDHSYAMQNLLDAMKKDISLLKYYLLDPDGYIIVTGDEAYDEEEREYFNPDIVPRVSWGQYEEVVFNEHDQEYVYVKGN
jgi:hypothetical protein